MTDKVFSSGLQPSPLESWNWPPPGQHVKERERERRFEPYSERAIVDNYAALVEWVVLVKATWDTLLWGVKGTRKKAAFAVTAAIIEPGVWRVFSGEGFAEVLKSRVGPEQGKATGSNTGKLIKSSIGF